MLKALEGNWNSGGGATQPEPRTCLVCGLLDGPAEAIESLALFLGPVTQHRTCDLALSEYFRQMVSVNCFHAPERPRLIGLLKSSKVLARTCTQCACNLCTACRLASWRGDVSSVGRKRRGSNANLSKRRQKKR